MKACSQVDADASTCCLSSLSDDNENNPVRLKTCQESEEDEACQLLEREHHSLSSLSCIDDMDDKVGSQTEETASGYSTAASKVFGGRFSKSPVERTRILSQRKEDLIRVARESFLRQQKLKTSENKMKRDDTDSSQSSS